MLTVQDIDLYIEYGRIAQFVISDYISKESFLGNPYFNPEQPRHIYCATKALIHAASNKSSSTSVFSLAQYQYSLYSAFIGIIQGVIDGSVQRPLEALLVNDDPQYLDTGFGQPLLYR